jgi:hypothetical protein
MNCIIFHPKEIITYFVTNDKVLCDHKISEGDIFIDFTTLVIHTFNVFDNTLNYKT